MNSLRFAVKTQLLREVNGKVPLCPLCQLRMNNPEYPPNPAVHLHEIICPPLNGSKYEPTPESSLAKAVYVRENCLLLCFVCNVNFANSVAKDVLLALKMGMPGYTPERIVAAMQAIASQLKNPCSYIPRVVSCNGITYPIL